MRHVHTRVALRLGKPICPEAVDPSLRFAGSGDVCAVPFSDPRRFIDVQRSDDEKLRRWSWLLVRVSSREAGVVSSYS
jgi:hypothetical protein